jgi:hypothetical protein
MKRKGSRWQEPGPPDFLWNLMASVNFMRLSEKKQVQSWLLGKAPPPRKIQQQVPPLRYAPVGMTNLLLGQSCPE